MFSCNIYDLTCLEKRAHSQSVDDASHKRPRLGNHQQDTNLVYPSEAIFCSADQTIHQSTVVENQTTARIEAQFNELHAQFGTALSVPLGHSLRDLNPKIVSDLLAKTDPRWFPSRRPPG